MSRQFLLFVLGFLPVTMTHAQDSLVKPASRSRWQTGISASADYDYRTLINGDGSQVAAMIIDGRNNKEVAKFGYSGGLNIRYQIADRLRLGAGVHYADRGYKTKQGDMAEFDPTTGYAIIIGTAYTAHYYHYLEVPLTVDWRFYNKAKINFYVSGGIAPGMFLAAVNESHIKYNNGSKEVNSQKDELTAFNKITLSATIALGAEYKLSANSIISVAPTFRYGLTALTDAPVREFVWSGGLNIGYYRSF